ncbi:AAA family ATPase [Neptunomonas concharum]|uniref:AAA family ATPase n=2 Tax=Neptunomonas concharum TaxID=1031538 RepID=A0A5P1RFG5_9GAMM|nr:AAA family ATPase [Neptunomonas concharum]
MKIDFVEVKNFRKLQRCRIDFDSEKTLLVGANNSGKTSAMVALRKFLLSPEDIEVRDVSISNWTHIDGIGSDWENGENSEKDLSDFLPSLDVWLYVPLQNIHHVVHILPSVDWDGGNIGVRLQFELKSLDKLKEDFLAARKKAKEIETGYSPDEDAHAKPSIEPISLVDFLHTKLSIYTTLKAYSLDTAKLVGPDSKGAAQMQQLEEDALELASNPFKGLINIREIPALRDFSDGKSAYADGKPAKSERMTGTLSGHIRGYYEKHIESADNINQDDINAFGAIQKAENAFDQRLKHGLSHVLKELEDLGVPGVNNPNIVFNPKFKSLDGLSHDSVVQYRVSEPVDNERDQFLPESYAGLGYQNLIAMIFMLIRFRQDWIEPQHSDSEEVAIAPIQLVMIEEPEAHLHAQVQQVFIKKAYTVLRNHKDLSETSPYSTQLLVSTHSSHVSHEVDFSNLRYFRRLLPSEKGKSATSTVVDLSNIYGEDKKTYRFVKRYIKATDCDLFFADGAIFVEGQAERILVPHFIREHFENLWGRYISLIDIGGSNARRFQPLIQALGLTSLVITDLDAGIRTKVPKTGGGETTRTKKVPPAKSDGQVTTNPTLKAWHPKLEKIDELLELSDQHHSIRVDENYYLYVAYQKQVTNPNNPEEMLIPRTFEDALIYENFDSLREIEESLTTRKIKALLDRKDAGEELELEGEIFEIVNNAEKAEFAIECLLAIDEGTNLTPPKYIAAGLKWLDEKLQETIESPLAEAGDSNG